jgi:hypothetical protein
LCNLVAQSPPCESNGKIYPIPIWMLSPPREPNLDDGDPQMLLFSMTRSFKFLPGGQRQAFWEV